MEAADATLLGARVEPQDRERSTTWEREPMITLLQEFVASLDQYLPWLLPAMEAIEHSVPLTARLLLCVPLMALVALVRQRDAASDASRLHRAAL